MRVVVVLQARAVSFADMADEMSEDTGMEGQQATGGAGGGGALRRTLTCPQFGGE